MFFYLTFGNLLTFRFCLLLLSGGALLTTDVPKGLDSMKPNPTLTTK